MSDLWKTNGSFLFGTTDMYATFGIKLTEDSIPEDVLFPVIRSRKVTIPQRHGTYDYGAQYYNERQVKIQCVTNRTITREESREIAFILSKKSEIRFWTEPEKYYVGRVYEAPSLEQLRNVGNRFSMTFTCEPFAYGLIKTENFTNGRTYIPNYPGTAATSTYIVIRNAAASGNVSNIKITQVDREENY